MKDPPETHCGGREQGKLMWIQMKFILNDEEIGQAADFSDLFVMNGFPTTVKTG